MNSPGAGPAGHVDLHMHSTASDGIVSPAGVVRKADEAGLSGLSLTDHDTVDGLEEAAREAERRGLRFLPGAELSANEPGRSVHVLGYGFDVEHPDLLSFFSEYRRDRIRRAREIVDRLNRQGVALTYAAVEAQTKGGVPTRAHVARALVEAELVTDMDAVFDRYLSRGRPAFVEKRSTPPAEVFERVRAAGGVTILAHPGRSHGPDRIRRWVREGLDGVEVLHPANDPAVSRRLDALADELGLLRGGGSDWHGDDLHPSQPGSQRVPAAWMDRIVERCGRALTGG